MGFTDLYGRLQCNPYLIMDGDEGVLIDGGSRPDFSTVMMKIMETGMDPKKISTLIYHHYDPDLCGSIPHLEDIIGRDDLTILSHKENNIFIRHYAPRSELKCINDMGLKLVFKSGRTLRFFLTPYGHSAGSFMTLDEKTGILFTSDIFGSYQSTKDWELFVEFPEACIGCTNSDQFNKADFKCHAIGDHCPTTGILNFHRRVMPSNNALRHALSQVQRAIPSMIAPQHGPVLYRDADINHAIDFLGKADDIGIDGVIKENNEK